MMIDMKSNKHNTNDALKQNSNNDNLKGTMDMESDVNIHVQMIFHSCVHDNKEP